MKIVCLNIGQPESLLDYNSQQFDSAIKKQPVTESLWLSRNGLQGDQVAAEVHGGPSRAMHVFCSDNYAFYNAKAGFDLPVPAFGENLTLSDYDEAAANVGDVLQIGEAVIQVSQPTERCAKIGQSLGLPQMLKWIHEELRTGFYVRVLQEGKVRHDDDIDLRERGPSTLNVAALNRLLFKELNRPRLAEITRNPLLSPEWKARAELLYARAGL